MTNTSTKGGFFAKALAAACSVALVASLTPAAAVSAFAAANPGEIDIEVYYDKIGSQADFSTTVSFEELAVDGVAQNALYYSSAANASGWGVYTARNYVTIDDIMANSDAKSFWNDEASKVVITGTAGEYETTYAALTAPQYFYPNTTKTAQNTADAVQVKPGIALKSVDSLIGDPVENTTAADQAKTNWGKVNQEAVTGNANVFFHGLTASEYANVYNTYSSTFVQGANKIQIVVPTPSDAQRVAGNIWADTMTEAFDQFGATKGGETKFVLTTADSYQDTLAASPLAGALGTPILMTEGGQLTAQTEALIKKYANFGTINTADVTFYVIGGPNAISENVLNQIRSITGFVGQSGLKFERIAGETAWDTSVAVRDAVIANTGKADEIIVATQNGFQDALSVAPYAYASKTPIVLTNLENELSDETVDALLEDDATNQMNVANAKVTILGGPNAVSYSVDNQLNAVTLGGGKLNRIAGNDCWETSNMIATAIVDKTSAQSTIGMNGSWTLDGTGYVGVATSDDYYDALSGAALCGKNEAPMLLVSNSNTYTIDNFLAKHNNKTLSGSGYGKAKVFGGVNVVSNAVLNDVETVLNEE